LAMRAEKTIGRRRRPEAERRRELIDVAYRHLAERGFEGLRVREVAHEAGVNHATLLHYYPTKEALVQGVIERIAQQFDVSLRRTGAAVPGARGGLGRGFADVRERIRPRPELFVGLSELAMRSRRDPALARILQALVFGWRTHLAGIVRRGVAEGAFRADVDVDATVATLTAQIAAIGFHLLGPFDAAEADRLVASLAVQTEHWLTVADPSAPELRQDNS